MSLNTQTAIYITLGLFDCLHDSPGEIPDSPGGVIETSLWIEDSLAPLLLARVAASGVPLGDIDLCHWCYVISEGLGNQLAHKANTNGVWVGSEELASLLKGAASQALAWKDR